MSAAKPRAHQASTPPPDLARATSILNEALDSRPSLEKIKKVQTRTALSRPSIYRKVNDGTFPRPINLGARAVAWLASDVDAWIYARVQASRAVSPDPETDQVVA